MKASRRGGGHHVFSSVGRSVLIVVASVLWYDETAHLFTVHEEGKSAAAIRDLLISLQVDLG
jgi:hypothetical protein